MPLPCVRAVPFAPVPTSNAGPNAAAAPVDAVDAAMDALSLGAAPTAPAAHQLDDHTPGEGVGFGGDHDVLMMEVDSDSDGEGRGDDDDDD